MCRRKRSRPSSRRRETKNVKRLSPACVGWTRPTGVVDAQRLTTKRGGFAAFGDKLVPAVDTRLSIELVACCIRSSPVVAKKIGQRPINRGWHLQKENLPVRSGWSSHFGGNPAIPRVTGGTGGFASLSLNRYANHQT